MSVQCCSGADGRVLWSQKLCFCAGLNLEKWEESSVFCSSNFHLGTPKHLVSSGLTWTWQSCCATCPLSALQAELCSQAMFLIMLQPIATSDLQTADQKALWQPSCRSKSGFGPGPAKPFYLAQTKPWTNIRGILMFCEAVKKLLGFLFSLPHLFTGEDITQEKGMRKVRDIISWYKWQGPSYRKIHVLPWRWMSGSWENKTC